ncbi:MAG: hypothetical protein HYV25_00695 [Candidatus Harrisonbacteria bacterium]|nr:hypothetical protein [Candidatus Harrisonbacteria bacterium]
MTKQKIIIIVGVLVFIIILVFVLRGLRDGGDVGPVKEPLPETVATIDLLGDETGVAFITVAQGLVEIQYGLVDAPEGVLQPAHIYAGTCAALGELKYLLDAPVDGISVTALLVSLDEFKKQLPLAIAVNKSLEEIGTYVACGDIVL